MPFGVGCVGVDPTAAVVVVVVVVVGEGGSASILARIARDGGGARVSIGGVTFKLLGRGTPDLIGLGSHSGGKIFGIHTGKRRTVES